MDGQNEFSGATYTEEIMFQCQLKSRGVANVDSIWDLLRCPRSWCFNIKTSYLDLYVINWNHSRPQDRKKLNTHFKSHHKRFQVFKQTNFLNQNFPCTYYMAPFNKLPQILTNLNTAQLAWLNNMTAVRLLFLLFMFLIIQYIIQCDPWTQYQKTKSNVVKQDVWCGRQAWCHVFKFFIHEPTKLKPCK